MGAVELGRTINLSRRIRGEHVHMLTLVASHFSMKHDLKSTVVCQITKDIFP